MELIYPPDPAVGEPLFPTLGDQLCEFLESHAVYGPGDLKGRPLEQLSADWEYVTYRLYEHHPMGSKRAGRRRFKRGNISIRKGAAKTEFAAFIGFGELHPYAPVRFDGYNKDGSLAMGRPVVDPFIPMLANAKLQVEELAYGALKFICENCRIAECSDCSEGNGCGGQCGWCPEDGCYGPNHCKWCGFDCRGPESFDTSLERILRIGADGKADGKAVAVANSPDTNDGGRTTWNCYDETHRLYLPSEKRAVTTMDENLGKRFAQDPWGLAVTTAGEPGQNSVAEDDHFEAEAMARGEVERPSTFYFHRQASDEWDMDKFEDRCEAIREASGPDLAARTDIEELASRWDKPKADRPYLERVWCNRWIQQGAQAFNIKKWFLLARPELHIPRGAFITFGFDGARFRDATGVTLTDVRTGLQEPYYLSEKPLNDDDYELDENALTAAVLQIKRRYRVMLAYCDPAGFESTIGGWSMRFGESQYTKKAIVQEFWTNAHGLNRTIKAVSSYSTAIDTGTVTYSDTENGVPTKHGDLTRHMGNAGRKQLGQRVDIETGEPVFILGKLHRDRKFDLSMSGMLSWEARMDALPFLPKKSRSRVVRVR